MAVVNLGAILGAFVAISMARRRSTERKLFRHAYFVWVAVTVTLMAQVALTTGLNPEDSPSLITAENNHQHYVLPEVPELLIVEGESGNRRSLKSLFSAWAFPRGVHDCQLARAQPIRLADG